MSDESTVGPVIVGLTSTHGDLDWVAQRNRNYLGILAGAGIHTVILSPDAAAIAPDGSVYEPDRLGRLPDAVLDHLSGLVVSGGGDVHPQYFGQDMDGAEPEFMSLERDELELGLLRAAIARDLPIFGICRGCQVLNVAAGGSLIQHLEGHRSSPDTTSFHRVDLLPGSGLSRIVGAETMVVNTFHHQGIGPSNLAPLFVPAAVAAPDTWLIEAYESLSHRWVRGVQWHPERNFELDDSHRRIWQSFLSACRDTIPNRRT